MAGLFNKKKQSQRLWRPDFRHVEALPDTKTIRTSFILNFLAIALVVAFGSAYLIKEYSYQNLKSEAQQLEAQVSSNTNKNRQILDTNKRFQQTSVQVSEAVAFDWQPVPFYTLLEDLSGALQTGMVINSLQLSNFQDQVGKNKSYAMLMEIQGKVLEDAPITPAQLLKNYQDALRGMPSISDIAVDIEMTRFSRNNELGNFDFTLQVKIPIPQAPSL